MSTRLSVNMHDSTAAELKAMCDLHGLSFTEAIRKAVAIYAYLDGESARGYRIVLESKNDRKEMVLL